MEIKFKAFIKEYKKIVDIECIDFNKKIIRIGEEDAKKFSGDCAAYQTEYPFYSIELLQFTGKKDRLNNEIFVSHIVKTLAGRNREILFNEGSFGIKQGNTFIPCSDLECDLFVIVGNKFKNTELLNNE